MANHAHSMGAKRPHAPTASCTDANLRSSLSPRSEGKLVPPNLCDAQVSNVPTECNSPNFGGLDLTREQVQSVTQPRFGALGRAISQAEIDRAALFVANAATAAGFLLLTLLG